MKPTRTYPRLHIDTAPSNALGQAGGLLLTETVHTSGLGHHLKSALARWKKPFAVHDPAKTLLDLAITLALGGDALSDSTALRDEPDLYGPVASKATITRIIQALAADVDQGLTAINAARAAARQRVWELAGKHAPNHDANAHNPMVIDIDASLITAHSEKESAKPTYKKGFGFHPLLAFIDHGQAGTGEPVAEILRPGNAGSNTAADHIQLVKLVLNQLPGSNPRPGKSVLIRTDTAGGTHNFIEFLTKRRLSYSVGWMLPENTPELYHQLTELGAWESAYDTNGDPRDGADVAELTGVLDLDEWPDGMRVIVRRERPHPGAQLRFDDVDGYRLTAFATNTSAGQLAELEVRHRSRARCEDRIRIAKDSGLRNFPLQGFDQNRLWLAVVALAGEIEAWKSLLAFPDHEIRRWEPKKLRMHVYAVPATIARTARRVVVHVKATATWARIIVAGLNSLRALPGPAPG
ncbi:Transposase DDE domain-containing protein [Brevibacterium sp. 239c]|uniref:IS1380 family transposase n=1 Tax=Brevibacterium sp. 239c TaxID=1965356 RepID=UPI000C672304|nr:IS1380 family transposase [Brevibacterium sp. 239c]SMY05221.1 Transposase DDE domain-containing protein [Brevibacterium sp. 239c]